MTSPHTIPMIHMSIVSSVMDFVSELDAPVASDLTAAGLPSRIVDDPTGYVPVRNYCRWVHRQAHRQGIDNIGLRAAMRAGTTGLQHGLVDQIIASPSLYLGMQTFSRLAYRESSMVSIWLEERHDEVRLCHRGSLPRSVAGQPEMSWWALGILTQIVRLFLGSTWTPPVIAYPAQGGGLQAATRFFPHTHFLPDPAVAWIAIPRRSLAAGPVVDRREALCAFPEDAEPPEGIPACLEQLIEMRMADEIPRIEEAAESASLSVRSLQRRLDSEGLSYRQLVANVRARAARQLLSEDGPSVTDIASRLGYTDPSHFARAFRRMYGVSPMEYQRSLRTVNQ